MRKTLALLLPVVLVAGFVIGGESRDQRVAAYTTTGVKWSGTSATYYINPNFTDSAAGTSAQQLAQGADAGSAR